MAEKKPILLTYTHVLRFLLNPIIFLISFLIKIGDGTRWIIKTILFLPVKTVRFLVLKIFSLISGIGSSVSQSGRRAAALFKFRKKKQNRPKKIKIIQTKPQSVKIKKPLTLRVKLTFFFFGVLVSLLFFGAFQTYQFFISLPSPHLIGTLNYPVSTQIYDRKGRLIYEIYNDQNRTPVHLKELPHYTYEATIAVEDKEFYKHKGVSLVSGVLRAVRDMIVTKTLQGGSTITQQLVKSALLSPERTLDRKLKEIVLALWTEQVYTKDEILEMYINQVSYGGATYGIEEGSQTYFNKSAKDLTLSEAALLAGLPQAPTLYSPYTNPEYAKFRRDNVLKIMYDQKYITHDEYSKAIKTPLGVKPYENFIKAPHFVFYVKQLLEDQYGISQVSQGGMRVITSLDLDVQEKAETVLNEELDKVKSLNIGNGAILVTAPGTGQILAMVGSRDYYAMPSGAFNVTTALRQPGSSIKPLMYSLALERGYTAASVIDDVPTNFSIPGTAAYRPVNYDGKFHGKVTLRSALANSYNIPAVKVLNSLGVANFIDHATDMGISTFDPTRNYGLSLTLGGGEVKMTDMAVAFGVFANQGERVPLNPILKITDYKGNELYNYHEGNSKRVLSEQVAYIISSILSDNDARKPAFGPKSQLEIPGNTVAVKTGTTDSKKDNWTIGYTPSFLTTVWVGNNDGTPMNQYLASGVTGAAPIWNRVMTYLLNDYAKTSVGTVNENFREPDGIVKRLCNGRLEYFVEGTENKIACNQIKQSVTPSVTAAPVNEILQPTPEVSIPLPLY